VSSQLLPPAPVKFHITTSDTSNPLKKARDKIAKLVTEWSLPLSIGAIADLKLCTTEVVANALKHAGGECWITVTWLGEHLRVDVRDRSPRPPQVLESHESAESGRGLVLVEALAQTWDWAPCTSGKTVFFLIEQDVTLEAAQVVSTAPPKPTPPMVPA
jgi:anti-sigma regulatory factor (Ser/Thr protein kinase)